MGYQFKHGQFIKIFGLNGNLIKRHNKGGYSANRFQRIAEESRHTYVVRICDRLRDLKIEGEDKIWIYGSNEIVEMILNCSPVKLIYGGFLNFNSKTISNTKYWLDIITKSQEINYDSKYEEILEYLELNPDMLDFNQNNNEQMKFFIDLNSKDKSKFKSNQIPLESSSKYYSKLVIFDYIGVKFYNYEIDSESN